MAPTPDHYSDHIQTPGPPPNSSGPSEFDAAGLARAIVAGRDLRGWSTRELARRAGISQPYVVALERSRDLRFGDGPAPTVEVVARLAHALLIEPVRLFAAALRPAGRHALLVVEDRRRSPLDHARAASRSDVDVWVWASSSPEHGTPGSPGHRSIDLRRDRQPAYEPAVIADSLARELRRLGGDLRGRDIGLVFADTSAVMTTLDDPHAIVSFERRWARVVADAAAAVGARAAWNVCVYELGALRTLHDPVQATIDLMRSHDTVWAAHPKGVSSGASGARRILRQLLPPDTTRTAWHTTVERLVDELDLAA